MVRVTRRKHSPSKLKNKTARLALPVQKKPYGVLVAPGIFLTYRRNAGAGVWSVKASDGHGKYWLKRFALADDHEAANGSTVLDFFQAQDKAKKLARGDDEASGGDRPATVAEAIDAYEDDLNARGRDPANAKSLRANVSETMAAKPVALLATKELHTWRNGLVKRGLKPASANRLLKGLKAALNLAAKDDPRISTKAWDELERLQERDGARNVILKSETVNAIVLGCHDYERRFGRERFGVLIETLAETGARESQVLRCEVADLVDDDPAAPLLMMPPSRKGGGAPKVERQPLPISPRLAAMLRQASAGRAANEPLLDKQSQIRDFFHAVTARLGLGDEVTPYALRHSSIVRQLLARIPTRVVAAHHDTSVREIEAHYSRYIIGDQTDIMVRRSLLEVAAPTSTVDNVVALAGR
jgi:integrase